MTATGPEGTVVIATRSRPGDLRRCLEALHAQRTQRQHEVIVVDDGGSPAVETYAPDWISVIRLDGRGISAARNAGIEAAAGSVVAFLDDDVEPDPGWLDSALGFLGRHPEHVGVEGPVATPPFDPLREKSVDVREPGTYRGCNVAYRRAVLDAVGGFSAEIPRQGEDFDLGLRALERGPIGWEPGMRVVHRPRSLSFMQLAARSRDAPMEVVLMRRHRARLGRAGRIPAYLFPYANIAYAWGRLARAELPGVLRRPRRLLRLLALPLAQAAFATMGLIAFWLETRKWGAEYRPPPGAPR